MFEEQQVVVVLREHARGVRPLEDGSRRRCAMAVLAPPVACTVEEGCGPFGHGQRCDAESAGQHEMALDEPQGAVAFAIGRPHRITAWTR